MKKIVIALISLILVPINLYAGYVHGYYRSNGTYVNGYYRTEADGNPYNNYSTPGNYNPNTGTITGGSLDSYLERYYNKSSGGSSYGSTYTGSSLYDNSYSNYYSVPTTPSCPSMATYDSFSGSCKCMSGYVVDSTGNSCISGNSYCWNKFGYGSSFDSLDKTCSCDYGYKMDSTGQCVYNNSSYNGYSSASDATCPINSHQSITDKDKCTCDSGYQTNSTKDSCVLIPSTKSLDQQCKDMFGSTSSWDSVRVSCVNSSANNTANNVTVSAQESASANTCTNLYGQGSYSKNSLCYCTIGYQWNTPITQCIKSQMTLSSNLKIGSTGIEVVMLKNFLANQGFYNDKVNTPYDSSTYTAVAKFQSQNGITVTGTVGPATRAKINKLMLGN